ncbi:MAG: hypothetical protein C4519_03450 [Desulfobacteraceae bacterium]|nr:MAG: hypothetical protein C4519_03450 [Desulfobacteraceae bacterium]
MEKMIADFQQSRKIGHVDPDAIQKQIEAVNKRMAYLTTMFLTLDRRMKPLYEVIRLLLEKSEILNQRIDTVIDSLGSGDPL